MSLINEALKRAQASQDRSPVAAVHEPPLRPALELAGRRSPALSQMMAAAVTVLVLIAAGIWLWRPAPQSLGGTVRPALSSSFVNSEKPVRPAAIVQPEPLPAPPVHALPVARQVVLRAASTAPAPTVSEKVVLQAAVPQPAVTRAAVPKPVVTQPTVIQPVVKQAMGTQTVASESKFPTLTLQAIHYRLGKPSARINGHTVFRGDTIEGARVISIERQAVQLLVGGGTNVLRML